MNASIIDRTTVFEGNTYFITSEVGNQTIPGVPNTIWRAGSGTAQYHEDTHQIIGRSSPTYRVVTHVPSGLNIQIELPTFGTFVTLPLTNDLTTAGEPWATLAIPPPPSDNFEPTNGLQPCGGPFDTRWRADSAADINDLDDPCPCDILAGVPQICRVFVNDPDAVNEAGESLYTPSQRQHLIEALAALEEVGETCGAIGIVYVQDTSHDGLFCSGFYLEYPGSSFPDCDGDGIDDRQDSDLSQCDPADPNYNGGGGGSGGSNDPCSDPCNPDCGTYDGENCETGPTRPVTEAGCGRVTTPCENFPGAGFAGFDIDYDGICNDCDADNGDWVGIRVLPGAPGAPPDAEPEEMCEVFVAESCSWVLTTVRLRCEPSCADEDDNGICDRCEGPESSDEPESKEHEVDGDDCWSRLFDRFWIVTAFTNFSPRCEPVLINWEPWSGASFGLGQAPTVVPGYRVEFDTCFTNVPLISQARPLIRNVLAWFVFVYAFLLYVQLFRAL